jgi:glycosyltransferase involved in cell wall biosynthesis
MMLRKVAFIHDHIFFYDSKRNFYSEGKLPLSAFDRFLGVSESVEVISRARELSSDDVVSQLVLASSESVTFSPVKGTSWKDILFSRLIGNFIESGKVLSESDLVVLRLPCFLSIIIFPLLIVMRKKYAVEVVGDVYESINGAKGNSFPYKIFAALFMKFTKIIIRKSVGAIYVTRSTLQAIYPPPALFSYASNVSIMPVSKELLQERQAKIDRWQAKAFFVVGIMGSYNNNYKGIDVLIRAISLVRKNHNLDVQLEIVGTGNRNIFVNVIKECSSDGWIKFKGRLNRKSVYLWLDEIDIYVQPSRTEGLPRALIEAMSRACPAIATDVGGIPELLPQEYLVPPESSELLAEKISFLISHKEEAKIAARESFYQATHYSEDSLKERRDAFWREVSTVVCQKGRS